MKPTDKLKLEAQKENFAEKKVNKISSNLPVIKSVLPTNQQIIERSKQTIAKKDKDGKIYFECDFNLDEQRGFIEGAMWLRSIVDKTVL